MCVNVVFLEFYVIFFRLKKIDKILYLVLNMRCRKGMGCCFWVIEFLLIIYFLFFNDKKLFCSYSVVICIFDIIICYNFMVIIFLF